MRLGEDLALWQRACRCFLIGLLWHNFPASGAAVSVAARICLCDMPEGSSPNLLPMPLQMVCRAGAGGCGAVLRAHLPPGLLAHQCCWLPRPGGQHHGGNGSPAIQRRRSGPPAAVRVIMRWRGTWDACLQEGLTIQEQGVVLRIQQNPTQVELAGCICPGVQERRGQSADSARQKG